MKSARPELHRLDHPLDCAVGRNDHDVGVWSDTLHVLQNLDPVHAGHLEVRDDQIRGLFLQQLQATGPAFRRPRPMATAPQKELKPLPDGVVVVDDEDLSHWKCFS